MRIIVDNIADIPYEDFIFKSYPRNTETGIHHFFTAISTANPKIAIELKEIYSEEELKELINTISTAYCNGAKRVNI
jgi:hypothetical protein